MVDAAPVISDEVKAMIAAREALILGHEPRIHPMKPEEFSDELRAITAELKTAAGLPPSDYVPEFLATALKHHTLYMANLGFAVALMSQGALAPRDRELLILRTAWVLLAPFEWGEHVAASYRMTDLTALEIDRITLGSAAEGWSTYEAALLRAVEELFADAMITDATWAVLATRLDERQLMELCLLVGQYAGVAFLQNSIRARLMPNGQGLSAR
jgi:alkylhydroperoxidase family enzyme